MMANQSLWICLFFVVVLGLFGAFRLRGGLRPAPYRSKRLLNASEGKLFVTMERWRREEAPDLNLAPQVSYGAFIGAKQRSDWIRVASKRADFVFFGGDGFVRAIVEYDGAGHFGDSRADAAKAKASDALKEQAALAANIPLIRVPPEATVTDIRETLREILKPERSASSTASEAPRSRAKSRRRAQ